MELNNSLIEDFEIEDDWKHCKVLKHFLDRRFTTDENFDEDYKIYKKEIERLA